MILIDRPNGPRDLSPGLRPEADTLGKQPPQTHGLKGRENLSQEMNWTPEKTLASLSGRGV